MKRDTTTIPLTLIERKLYGQLNRTQKAEFTKFRKGHGANGRTLSIKYATKVINERKPNPKRKRAAVYTLRKTYFRGSPRFGRTTTLLKDGKVVLELMGVVPKRAAIAQYEGRLKPMPKSLEYNYMRQPNPSQVARVQARGGKRFVVATDSKESDEQLLNRVNAVKVLKRVNTSANPSSPVNEWDDEPFSDDELNEAAKQGWLGAGAMRREHGKRAVGPKYFRVTWYSPLRGKRTGFVQPIEAHTAAEAKRQAKAMVENDPKASNFVAKEVARNPKRRKTRGAGGVYESNAYSKAVSLGYPYVRGDGKVASNGETWLNRFTKTYDGKPPAIYVGFDDKKKTWIVEHENPSAVGEKIAQLVHEGTPRKQAVAIAFSEQRAKLNPSPYDEAVTQLEHAIRETIADAKANGGLGMSKANLKQVTSVRGVYLPNTNAFNRAFDDALARVKVKGFRVYNPHTLSANRYRVTGKQRRTIFYLKPDRLATGFKEKAAEFAGPDSAQRAADKENASKIWGFKWRVERFTKPVTANPSTREMSERFNGHADGSVVELKAANGAPSDLSRGGKLVLLKLADKSRALRIPGAVVTIDPKTERLWIAGDRAPLLNRKAKPGQRLNCGEIDRIIYETAKRHIGNGKTFEYDHKFGENGGRKPSLYIDADGMPLIVGGDYKIRPEGIVN